MRSTVRRLRSAAAGLAALAVAAPASALTLRVHPDSAAVADHYATLVEANAAAVSGDTIEVSSAGSPYIQTDVLTMIDGVTYVGGFGPDFEGPDADAYETVIELQAGPGLFVSVLDAIATGSGTLLEGFTVTGGNSSFAAGGIYCGDLTIRNCRFTGNHASVVGGGIMVPAGSTPLIIDCDVDACTAGQRGGGIAVAAGADGTRIESNRITACSSASNGISTGGGGGVFLAAGVDFIRNTVQACTTGTHGGAILVRNATDVNFLTNFLFDNVAALDGGGVCQDGGSATYHEMQIERCTSGRDGGGGFFGTSTVTVRNSFVRNCSAFARGGGFCVDSNSGSFVGTTEFYGNHAATGGGVEVEGLPFRSTSVELKNNTFARNGASVTDAGGGIHFAGPGFFDPVVNNIVALQTDGAGIGIVGGNNYPNLRFNCVYNDSTNADGLYGGVSDRTGTNGNISAPPRFCGVDDDPPQLGVQWFSECADGGENGVTMGAHATADCGIVVSVERTTWSRIKSSYR